MKASEQRYRSALSNVVEAKRDLLKYIRLVRELESRGHNVSELRARMHSLKERVVELEGILRLSEVKPDWPIGS